MATGTRQAEAVGPSSNLRSRAGGTPQTKMSLWMTAAGAGSAPKLCRGRGHATSLRWRFQPLDAPLRSGRGCMGRNIREGMGHDRGVNAARKCEPCKARAYCSTCGVLFQKNYRQATPMREGDSTVHDRFKTSLIEILRMARGKLGLLGRHPHPSKKTTRDVSVVVRKARRTCS